jgi:hypothetical protein
MASSSSVSSVISIESETTQEMTPEFNPTAAYEACAPLYWDGEEWDFQAWLEDDESLTDGEDLQLLSGELDEDDDDDMSWEGGFSTLEEEVDAPSTEDDSAAGGFLRVGSSEADDDDDDEETEDGSGYSGDSGGDDGSDDNSDASAAPLIKHRKVSGTYWW